MRPDVVPGSTFPDYDLPDHESVARRLSEIQGDDPMVLTLARGHYCPKEHQQHLELAAHYPKLNVAYTKLATLVLQPGLVVHRIYNGYWFWGRPSFYDLWQDLREVSREVRPDWDLAAPGLREAWETGDVSRFHGWDRRAQATHGSV
jgi:hypothetical protein